MPCNVEWKYVHSTIQHLESKEQLLYLSNDKGNVSALRKQPFQLQTELLSMQFVLVMSSSLCVYMVRVFYAVDKRSC